MYRYIGADEACNIICGGKEFALIVHTNADGDAFGSALAMSRIIMALGGHADIISPEKPAEIYLPFLTFPVYTPDKAEPSKYDRVIALDVAAPVQLGRVRSVFEGKIDLVIDHHGKGELVSDGYVRPDAAATAEVIYELISVLQGRALLPPIWPELASALYFALSADTGCFRFPNTTVRAMNVGARLIEAGADNGEINRLLYMCKPIEELEAQRIVLNNLSFAFGGRFAYVLLDNNVKNGIDTQYFTTAVEIARSVKGVSVSAAIKEQEEKGGVYKLSMRSNGVDVSEICAVFGGGGHKNASGATIEAESAENILNMLLPEVGKALEGSIS